jgi:hypothetical protein
MSEKVDVAYFKILFQNLFGRTEETIETSGEAVSQADI